MSIQEIGEGLANLAREGQDEVAAFLFQLRHQDEKEYSADLERRVTNKNSSNWLRPDEFECQLDKKDEM